MSQEKIDRYKQEKANRKKNLKKQRTMSLVRKGVLALACVALVGWLGYSAYDLAYHTGGPFLSQHMLNREYSPTFLTCL